MRAKVRLDSEVRLAVSTEPDLSDAVYSKVSTATKKENQRIVALRVESLAPSTLYYYGVEVDGRLDAYQRGQLTTFPEGPASFSFAFASCSRTGSNGAVFDTIRSVEPLLFLEVGDLHYENIASNDMGKFLSAYDKVLTAPAQSALYRSLPIAYVWDDHDFGGNNSDSSSAAKEAARLAYRRAVPHYELPAGDGNAAIYHAFSVGRVRFIMSDLRSERTGKSMISAEQMAWLKREMLAASRTSALIVWASSDPWISDGGLGEDDWGGYQDQRREIADFIAVNGISNLMMIAGDAHMLAIDDGTNSNYATKGDGGFPVFHAAALDRPASLKGGPYSEGAIPGAGQFGLVTVTDDGKGPVRVLLEGMNYTGFVGMTYEFTVPAPTAAAVTAP